MSVRPYHYISCSFYRILSISHTGHHYNVAGVMGETFFFSGRFLPFLGLSVRPSVRTTISPAVFIGFFQYRTQGIITMSRASWEKLLFFFGSFSGRFLPFLGLSVRTYHYISCSFYRILSISHTGHHYNVAGVMGETSFYGRVIFGPFSAIFRLKKASNSKFVDFFQYRTHGIVTISRAS